MYNLISINYKCKFVFSNTSGANNAASAFNDMMSCPHHRDILLPLSCIIQVMLRKFFFNNNYTIFLFFFLQIIVLECPTSLIWNNLGGSKLPSVLNGSPLDHLPCSPVVLPMPQRTNNVLLR